MVPNCWKKTSGALGFPSFMKNERVQLFWHLAWSYKNIKFSKCDSFRKNSIMRFFGQEVEKQLKMAVFTFYEKSMQETFLILLFWSYTRIRVWYWLIITFLGKIFFLGFCAKSIFQFLKNHFYLHEIALM